MKYLDSDHIRLSDDKNTVIILDQSLLPSREEYKSLSTVNEMYDAIKRLEVRGAPLLGIFAGYSMYVLARHYDTKDPIEFGKRFHEDSVYLNSSRPTAVNLSWALNRMEKVFIENIARGIPAVLEMLEKEAVMIHEEDIAMCRRMGEYGLTLLSDEDGLLTHCNAGALAASRYGTQLSPVYLGLEQGINFRLYVDETRPLLQGARLTAYELAKAGVDTTLLCDNMANYAMSQGLIDAVIVGADRIASNGDTANKIGTSQLSVLAKEYNIPFYVFAPYSTIDMNIGSGDDIVIEEREPEEVTTLWYKNRMAPLGINVLNPAFDVTKAENITAIITDKGVIKPPFAEKFTELFKKENNV
ncbi:MAG: S-methyl-5-thioribose-1-phosphate isomerase [Lachnospiraceae bacterium]|nr:S-methyl-5-thioribose-1-phosphate isomerase [Lachnospiraceae bacterium]